MNDLSLLSSSDMKPNDSSHGVESNGPDPVDTNMVPTPVASSPVPISRTIATNA